MGSTSIEWTDKVWNPVTGCTKVSAGCKNCYAERMFHRPYPGRDFTDVRCHPERLDQPLHWRKPCRIFVNSMSDLFHEAVPFEFIDKLCGITHACGQHTFQILTKRPERMLEYEKWRVENNPNAPSWPANVWLGVSVEDQKAADERIPLLLQTPAAVRWVSYEPALGPVDFRHIQHNREVEIDTLTGNHGVVRPLAGRSDAKLNWLVAGGESGPHARPAHPDWFRSVRDQCQAAGVPFFFKQWGEWTGDPIITKGCPEPTHPYVYAGGWGLARVGKKRAGRLLDGREWSEFPILNSESAIRNPEAAHAHRR